MRELSGITRDSVATVGYKGLRWGYKGLQGVTGGYEGLQGLTRGYRGLQAVTGVSERKNEHEFYVENPTCVLT